MSYSAINHLPLMLFLNRRARTVPVFFPRGKPDDVTGPDLLHRFTSVCTRPKPALTRRVCPGGCVCQAVRAPGSKVTLAPLTRAGFVRSNSGSIRTVQVNQSFGPFADGWEPLFLISNLPPFFNERQIHRRPEALRPGRATMLDCTTKEQRRQLPLACPFDR